ncbi:hypothetical protein B0H12DRAFT_1278866 [Mycena haematopus]|nr:hypothetical protein B0H12DRAFT_1278866 [Mycena haematopus]
MRASTLDADKAKAFKNYLVSGSEADRWFKALPVATRASMDLIDAAVEAQYPEQQEVQPTAGEYGAMLTKEKLKMEELGTKVTVADREVWAHHAWASKMLRYATSAGISGTDTYVEVVRIELPRQLRTKIPKTFANWKEFVKAIREVDTVELEMEMKEWRDEKAKQDRLAQLVALQASPTAGIRNQLANAKINAPVQGPARWPGPAAGANPFQNAGGGGRGNLFGAPRAVYPPQRRILLEAIGRITHHPDTEAGRRAHGDQQQEWFRTHGNVAISVNTPYPLRPGRAPVNSGECFRCGFLGHTNYQRRCEAPPDQCLSPREQQWRRVASQALKEAPTAVRAVGFTSWDVDDYGRPFEDSGVRFEEIDEQGNA